MKKAVMLNIVKNFSFSGNQIAVLVK